MAERVLVTGATGFVGRAVLAPLRTREFEVHGVTRERFPPPLAGEGQGGGSSGEGPLILEPPPRPSPAGGGGR
jgi:nucleoside-diphosphate-sugar epimerase